MVDHFNILYQVDPLRDLESEDFFLEGTQSLVSIEMNNALVSSLMPYEFKSIVFSFSPDRAPSPDVFLANFYKKFREVIRIDHFHMVEYSFKRFIMGGGINTSFLALIPEESNLCSFSKFFPISLCNV